MQQLLSEPSSRQSARKDESVIEQAIEERNHFDGRLDKTRACATYGWRASIMSAFKPLVSFMRSAVNPTGAAGIWSLAITSQIRSSINWNSRTSILAS